MPPSQSYPPRALCLLRLSALGDVSHMLPAVHTLRRAWPDTRLTWIVGAAEAPLLAGLAGVELVRFDKHGGPAAWRALARALRGRRFDGLFLMQSALRAGLASLCVRAPVRFGFDAARASEGHGLFVNRRIAPAARPHVVDGFLGFLAAAGIDPAEFQYRFDLPEDPATAAWAAAALPVPGRAVVLSPCAGHPERSWRAGRYAAVADHLMARGLEVAVTCAPAFEQVRFARRVCAAMRRAPRDLAGRTSLPQLLALMRRARFVLGPDSGPIHLATVAGAPALGLYAVSRVGRTGPYRSREWCVDRYDDAARRRLGRGAADLPWQKKVHGRGVMDLIGTDEVIAMADRLLDATAARVE